MDIAGIGIFVVLLLLSAFFSSSEISLAAITETRANYLVKKKKAPRELKKIKRNQEDTIIAILIGNNLVNIFASAYATTVMLEMFGSNGVAIATGVMTFLILTFGEIVPKSIAVRNAGSYLSKIAPILYYLTLIMLPLVLFFKAIEKKAKAIVRTKRLPKITEEEIEALAMLAVKEGEIDKYEKDIIEKLFDMTDTSARKILVPKKEMFSANAEQSIISLLKNMKKKKIHFTRIPIYEGKKDNIIGFVKITELYKKALENKGNLKLKTIAFRPIFVQDSEGIGRILEKMRKKGIHIGIVRNKKMKVLGMLTMEDILEELIGEIEDEKIKMKK